MPATALNEMFGSYADTAGEWTGADSTVSVSLPDGRTAWFFSDTFLGTVNPDGSRPANSPFISNSMLVQDGTRLVATRYGGTSEAPRPLVPAPANEMYWVADAIVEDNSIRALYSRMRKTGTGPLDFTLAGTALATFALPELTPTSMVDLPVGNRVAWGASLLRDGDYTYIYGSEFTPGGLRFAHLARVSDGQLGGAWSFWTGYAWSPLEKYSGRLRLSGVGTVFGVERIDGKYVLATIESNLPFNNAAVAYVADSPAGPFTGPVYLFQAPEASGSVIVYDLHIHPELAADGRMLVSYNVNSFTPGAVYADARLYRPRFVDVTWPPPTPDPSAVPAAPTRVSAVAQPDGSVRVSWRPPAGSGLTYQLYQRDITAGQTHAVRIGPVTGQTWAVAGYLTHNHRYEFQVTAINSAGEGPRSARAAALVTVPSPPAPTGLQATAQDDGTIRLGWNPSGDGLSYVVRQRDNTAGEADYTQLPHQTTGTSTVIAYLTNQHEYEFVVVASNRGAYSSPSNSATAVSSSPRPGPPTGLTAVPGDAQVTLTWQPSDTQSVWYLVRQRDVSAGESEFTQLPWPVTACCTMTAGYLVNGHVYQFKVVATGHGGESEESNMVEVTPVAGG